VNSTSWKILLAALGVAGLNAPAFSASEQVGVTAAVNPDATGQIPNEPLRELMVGHDVIRNERIKTASIGQAQLLFTDQSTLTVARNSEILIDEFVFDPTKQSGNLAATVTTGVFRYVGGKISKQKDVTFYTPTGSVSVRGGIVLFKVDGTTVTALFLFGEFMQLNANGHTQRTNQANTSITAIGGGPPSPPVPVNALTIQQLQQELQSNRSTPGNFPGIGEGFGQNGPFGPDVDLLLAANSLNLLPFSPPPPP
jgi:hypothetical protein